MIKLNLKYSRSFWRFISFHFFSKIVQEIQEGKWSIREWYLFILFICGIYHLETQIEQIRNSGKIHFVFEFCTFLILHFFILYFAPVPSTSEQHFNIGQLRDRLTVANCFVFTLTLFQYLLHFFSLIRTKKHDHECYAEQIRK